MQTNVIIAPNVYLKCYLSTTIAINTRPFCLDNKTVGNPAQRINKGSWAYDTTFPDAITFLLQDEWDALNLTNPLGVATKKVLNSTKKAVFKFNKHFAFPAQDFLCNYSLDGLLLNQTGANVSPFNMLAKDGDEVEIYGLDEIKKFHTSNLHSSMNPVPFLLTISLYK